ncbi:VIT and vWA domain-containing protein [Rubripirellula reticaptiva]|uniref:Vault protein inter-alpha-trypsin n=1 Tax=Rubripirellula reticaptiva TaxID=2528013 RepID=A0A5C6FCI1_9BACT|nr:VIT and VWA domain-containing protein [Rubripirellula reticaptiva]TWU57806.1 Vault protein inter-alpha-trypsin [Rubripirellula reticaptiva]
MSQSQRLTVAAAFAAATLLAIGSQVSPASAAGLLVADGGFGGVLEIQSQDVRVTINNSIAVTQVDQVFLNTENRQVEALYTFPVPREASVSNFSMWIGGKEMIGEVVEKQRAREIYNSYKQKRRDPGLLEQVDFKQFEMRIFPIAPGAEQRVRIEYYQELDIDHDWATYVYPLATNVNGKPLDTKVRGRFSMNVDLKSEVPIEELRSESHTEDFVVVSHQADYAQAAMELTEGDLSRDIVMAVQTKRARTGLDVVTSHPKGEDGYFMMTLTPGEDLSASVEPMDYVFLLDVSGSMARDDKLAISRNSVMAFIDSLGAEDRFDCLAFNLAPTPLFQKMETPTQDNLKKARDFFADQRARGGTVLQPALSAAYAYRDDDRPLNVVLLSDGMTELGEQAELLRLISSRPAGVRVFCIGVGNEVNRPLLEQIATGAGGLAAFVSTEDSFGRQAKLMRQKLVRPAIENLSLSFDGGRITDVEPTAAGDLFYGTPLRMYGRYGDAAAVTVTLRGQVQGAPWEQTVDMKLPADGDNVDGNSEIERMWAQKRVARLMAAERTGGASMRDEIVRLCEGYSIVSPHASMLVLENDAEFKRWKIEQRNAIRITRDRSSRQAVQAKLTQLRNRVNDSFELDRSQKLVSTKANTPAVSPQNRSAATPSPSAPPRKNDQNNNRGVDLDFGFSSGGGGGGGAIEPFTALIALGSAGVAALSRRRTNSRRRKSA